MNKKLLGLCLILLIFVVLVVSCSPDPIKKNKALGTWEYVIEDVYDITLTLTVTEGNFSLVMTLEGEEDPIGNVKGTWTASSVTKGELTVTEVEGAATSEFDIGTKAGFSVADNKLSVEDPDGGDPMVFTKK